MLVYDFKNATTEEPGFDEIPYVAAFEWPAMRPDIIPLDLMLRTDPAPVWKPDDKQKVPFYTEHTDRLIVVNYTVIVASSVRGLQLHVPSSTLLKLVNSLEAEDTRHVFGWDSWGRNGSRLTKRTNDSLVWVCYVFGMKYIMPQPYSLYRDGERMIQLMDYHPLRVQKALKAQEDGVKQEWEVVQERYAFFGSFISVCGSSDGVFAQLIRRGRLAARRGSGDCLALSPKRDPSTIRYR